MSTLPQPTDSQRYELEGHLRLAAAGVLVDSVTVGHWAPDDPVLEAIAELVGQAAHFYNLAGWFRPEARAA